MWDILQSADTEERASLRAEKEDIEELEVVQKKAGEKVRVSL